GKTVGHRSSSTRMKRMLGWGPGSIVPWANPLRPAILAQATAAVDFRKSLRFIVYPPMKNGSRNEECVTAESELGKVGQRAPRGEVTYATARILRWAIRSIRCFVQMNIRLPCAKLHLSGQQTFVEQRECV